MFVCDDDLRNRHDQQSRLKKRTGYEQEPLRLTSIPLTDAPPLSHFLPSYTLHVAYFPFFSLFVRPIYQCICSKKRGISYPFQKNRDVTLCMNAIPWVGRHRQSAFL